MHQPRLQDLGSIEREGLASIAEAVKFLSMSRSTVFDLLKKGTLPSVKVGKMRRIPRNALREFIATYC